MNINGRPVSADDIMGLVRGNQVRRGNSYPISFAPEPKSRPIPLRKWQKNAMHPKARGS